MASGDILVVWRLDRLGRSLKELILIVESLDQRGIELLSLQESLATHSSGGKLIFHLFGALAEFERHLNRERTQAGLKAARARGRLGAGLFHSQNYCKSARSLGMLLLINL